MFIVAEQLSMKRKGSCIAVQFRSSLCSKLAAGTHEYDGGSSPTADGYIKIGHWSVTSQLYRYAKPSSYVGYLVKVRSWLTIMNLFESCI